ncbi:hypothetical protein ACER0A_005175 [Haloimpatiens sp. FM7315]|uniref:hypothetical protein n=1 Tax=Haloimpatiens sp. FM7315 TaxID=3298609 RepID=UPI0035A30D29
MSIKKTISLQEDVFIVAAKKAKVICNGNLSNYINTLIYNANKEEIQQLQNNKPKRCGVIFSASRSTICEYCEQYIHVGDEICNSIYPDGHYGYTHVNCSKE